MMHELRELGQLLFCQTRKADTETLRKARDIINMAKGDIEAILK